MTISRKNILLKCLIAASILAANSACNADNGESEIRCCFNDKELDNSFSIVLINYGVSKTQLSVKTPDNKQLGYLKKYKLFTRPDQVHIYASEPPSSLPLHKPSYHKGRNYLFQLKQLKSGIYTVYVYGLKDSFYALSFYPAGVKNSKGVQHFINEGGIHITKGDTHKYTFNGNFDNVLDGSIPISSPTRFKVKRIK